MQIGQYVVLICEIHIHQKYFTISVPPKATVAVAGDVMRGVPREGVTQCRSSKIKYITFGYQISNTLFSSALPRWMDTLSLYSIKPPGACVTTKYQKKKNEIKSRRNQRPPSLFISLLCATVATQSVLPNEFARALVKIHKYNGYKLSIHFPGGIDWLGTLASSGRIGAIYVLLLLPSPLPAAFLWTLVKSFPVRVCTVA